MKDWSTDHPKAKLMARKRFAILDAAREAFLSDGYGRTTMEGIAKSAGVSIMTLYRHAESKDDLFGAVIASACHPADQTEMARIEELLRQPLNETLVFVGMMFQERITGRETVTLFRVVMVETDRFPHLAEMAFDGLIGTHAKALDVFLAQRPEAVHLDPNERKRLGEVFLSRLVGIDGLRALLGLNVVSGADRRRRAEAAANELLANFE